MVLRSYNGFLKLWSVIMAVNGRANIYQKNPEKKERNSRYWEFYFVRYFVGTVVSSVIIFLLNTLADSALKGKLLPSVKGIENLNTESLLTMGALGLAYCYIASAPVLVLHANRSAFVGDDFKCRNLWYLLGLVIGLVLAVCVPPHFNVKPAISVTCYLLFAVLSLQFYVLFVESRKDSVYTYYTQLTNARAKPNAADEEYIESYRHLREHGNAFLILFFIFILSVVFYSISNPYYSVLVLFVWIIPAAFVWITGNELEARLATRKK